MTPIRGICKAPYLLLVSSSRVGMFQFPRDTYTTYYIVSLSSKAKLLLQIIEKKLIKGES